MKIIGIFGIFILVNAVSGYGSFHYSKPPNIPSSYKAALERKEIRPLPPIVKTHLSKAVVVRVPVHKQEQVYSSKSSKENKEEERLVIVVPVPRVAGEKVYEDLELKEIRYQKKEESDFGNQPQNNYESQITSAETDRAPIYNTASKLSIVNPHQAQPNLQQPAQNMSYRHQQYFPRGDIKSAIPPHSTVVFVGNQQIQNSGSREIELDENRFHSQQPFNFHVRTTKHPGSGPYLEKDSNHASQYSNSFTIKNSNYGIQYSFPPMNYESGKIGGIDESHQGSVNKDEFRENMQQSFNPNPNNQSPHNSNLNEKPVSTEDKDNNPTIQHPHSTLKDLNQPSSSRITNYGSQEVKPVRKEKGKKIPVLLITLPHNKRPKTTTTKIQYDAWKPITKENEQIPEKAPIRQYSNSQPVNEMNQPEKKRKQYSPQISINFPTSNDGTYGHNEPNFNHGQISHNTQQVYHNQFGSNVFQLQQQQNKQSIRHNLHQSSELRQQINQPLHSQENTQFELSPTQRGHHNFNQNPVEQTQQNDNGNAGSFDQFPVRNFQSQNFRNSEYKKPLPISDEKQAQFEYHQNQNNFNQNSPIEQSQQNPIEQSQQNNYNDNDQRYDHSTEPSQMEKFQTSEFKQIINQPYLRGENSQVRFEQPTSIPPMVVNQVQNFNQGQLNYDKFQQENYNPNIPNSQPPREEFNAQIVPPPNQGQIFQNQEYVQPNNQPYPSLDKSQVRIEPISIPLSQIQPNFNQIQNGESNYNQPQLETTRSPTQQHDIIQKQEDENRGGQKDGKDTEGLLLVLVSTKKYKGDEINPKQQIMARENIEEQNVQLPADMNYAPSDRTSVISYTKTNDYQTGYSIMY